MKKVFNLLVSFVLIAGFSACSKDDSGNQQQEPEYPSPTPVPSADYKGLAFISSGESTVRLAQVGTRMKFHWNTALMNPIGSHTP